ncbi:MAG: radical SAM/SPASM domain-containing protein [Thermoanaerobaculia bacterium]
MVRPLNVILDVTARCNLRCVMCHFSRADRIHFPPFDVRVADDGNMPVPVFEKIAEDLFPRAWRVALACAAEPMIHPKFRDILAIAGRYGVPDLWFPTNLLALSEDTARAIAQAGVRTVAASIDGCRKETYEKIRVGGRWEALLARLEILRKLRRDSARRRPRLRIIFTWMQSNREDLALLPEFASEWGAQELDVRYVSPSFGVDVTEELLSGEDPALLNAELERTAREAVRRGIRLSAYPEYESAEALPRNPVDRARRRLWRVRAGIDNAEHLRYALNQRLHGCAYPGRDYVIRPNGAVSPCIYWQEEPIGFYPAQGLPEISAGQGLARIRSGLRSGAPVGTCASCSERRTALYRFRGSPLPGAAARLPTHPA